MKAIAPLLITAFLLLIPLVPAAILYVVLSPKRSRGEGDSARGELVSPLSFGKFKLQFRLFGATATYGVLLLATFLLHQRIEGQFEREESLKEQSAWLVEIPIGLTMDSRPMDAKNGEMQQVRVDLEPAFNRSTANTVHFWVVPNGGSFPTARLSLAALSQSAVVVDLNDRKLMRHELGSRRIVSVEPVKLPISKPYNPGGASGAGRSPQ